jgi:multiple sugar transport system substrate-binding protein
MNGRLAMFMSSRRSVPQFRSIEDFSWDVAPIPVNSEPANVLHSDAFCLTADSEHHDQAWEFVEFALGAEGQRLLSATGRTVPSRIEVAESAAFLDPSSPPSRATVFLDAIPHIRRLPTLSTWPEIEDIADVLIEEAMFDTVGGDVPDALTVAEEAVELVTALRTETLDAFERAQR